MRMRGLWRRSRRGASSPPPTRRPSGCAAGRRKARAAGRAGWAAEALTLLRRRGVPVPVPRWWGRLDERWWALFQPQLPGEPLDALDEPVLERLLALVELQADHDLGAGGWDVSWWIDKVV